MRPSIGKAAGRRGMPARAVRAPLFGPSDSPRSPRGTALIPRARILVENADAAARDRAHGQLLVPGHAELADQEDVERRAERSGDLVADRHATAGQRQNYDIGSIGELALTLGEHDPGLTSIRKAGSRG